MAKKLNVNDAAVQQKMRVLMKLRDSCIRSEKDLQGMTAETMLAVKDVNMDEMHIIVELQNSVKSGKLFPYLIEAQEILIPETVLNENGEEITESDTFVADRKNGTRDIVFTVNSELLRGASVIPKEPEGDIEIEFTFDASALSGTTLVAFEKVDYKGIDVAVHADINDDAQTVYIPKIRTSAYDAKTRIDHSKAENKVTLYDQVTFTNLLPERDYVMKGYLVDKKTGEPILVDGKRLEKEKEFYAEAESGVVTMEFTFDAALVTPDPIVVFESLYYKEIEIAVHADVEDEKQSDYVPEIRTMALAEDTNDHITNADEEVTIIDTVFYRGLKPNTKYEVTGTLMDKESGEKIFDAEGKEITRPVSFVTGDAEEGEVRVDGKVKVTFTFDGSNLAGRTTVVFETLYRDGKEVAVHADLEDEEQTIHFPDAKTTATDTATETHTAHLDEKVVIEDVVKYTNLIPGKTYTVKGTLMDKESGKALLKEDGEAYEVEKEFEAKEADGEVTLSFTIDTTKLVGKSIVVFEDVQYEGITVVLHADLEDQDQTVTVPKKPDEPDIPPQILGIHLSDKGMYLIMLLAVSCLASVMLLILRRKQHNR